MESAENPTPLREVLTMEEALARAKRGKLRLVKAGLPTTRNIEGRLAWKRARGIDTTLEERVLRPRPPMNS